MTEEDVPPFCPQCDRGNAHGYEIRGVYDGILLWRCQYCHHMWPRFSPPGRLHDEAMEIIAGWSKANLGHPE
jgi:uncharacterized membrane protein